MTNEVVKLRKGLLIAAIATALAACGGGGGGGGGGTSPDGDLGLVDPGDADAMMESLNAKLGGQDAEQLEGDPPQSDADNPDNPTVTPGESASKVAPGETKEIDLGVETAEGSALAVLYAKVSGSNSYFRASPDGGSAETAAFRATRKQEGGVTVAFDIPSNTDAGSFCVDLSAGDDAERVSPTEEVCFDVETDEFSVANVIRGLQGAWERCVNDDGVFRKERVDIDGRVVGFSELVYEQAGCEGQPFDAFADYSLIDIGPRTELTSGEDANEFDVTIVSTPDMQDLGSTEFNVLKLDADNGQFFIGEGADTEQERPMTLSSVPLNRVSRDARTIFGSWKPSGDDENDLLLLNFLRNGTYTHAEVDDDDQVEDSGMEWGYYQYNALTDQVTVQERFDNNGDTGLNNPGSPNSTLFATADGDRLPVEVDEDGDGEIDIALEFTRQPSEGLRGTWLARGTVPGELILINFFSDAYVLHEVDQDRQSAFSGLEWSDYQVEPETGALMVIENFIDQNSDAGLTDGGTSTADFTREVDGNVLTIEVDEDGDGVTDEVVTFDRQ